jgi:hypothetical protein
MLLGAAAMIAGHEQMHSLHIEAHLPPDDALYRIRDVASAAAAARLPRGTVHPADSRAFKVAY